MDDQEEEDTRTLQSFKHNESRELDKLGQIGKPVKVFNETRDMKEELLSIQELKDQKLKIMKNAVKKSLLNDLAK